MSTLTSTTSTTRPTLGASDVGESYFETDSNRILVWDGTAWQIWNNDLVITPGLANNNFSLSVDGVDDSINCGNIGGLAGGTAFTLAFWWKPAVSGEGPSMGTRYRTHSQIAFYKNVFAIATQNVTPASKTLSHTPPTGTDWRYYVLSYNAGSAFLHINGTQIFSESGFPPSLMTQTSSSYYWSIGIYGNQTGSSNNSEGLIDDVAIWSSALSTSAATTLYNSGNPFDLTADSGNYNQSSNLIAYWKMGDGSGDTAAGGVSISDGATVGGVQNLANPGTYDGTGTNGATYASKSADSNNVPY